jgi:hypothetical protein
MTSAALASAVQMPTKRSASVPIELEKLSTTPKTLVVDDTDDTVVAAINDGCCAAVRHATAHEPAIWILFVDYFLSSWSDRMWAFALPVLFVEKLQSQAGHEDDVVNVVAAVAGVLVCVVVTGGVCVLWLCHWRVD